VDEPQAKAIPSWEDDEAAQEKRQPKNLPGFLFDREYFQEVSDEETMDGGGMAIFRLVNGKEEKFLHIFNSHNGYYSHGFTVEVGGKTTRDGCL